MLSQTLIINASMHEVVKSYRECMSINYLLKQLVGQEILNCCEGLNIEPTLITCGYEKIYHYSQQLCNIPEDFVPLLDNEYNLLELTEPIKNFVEVCMYNIYVKSGISAVQRTNFSVMFVPTGTIFITQESFTS